MIISWVHTGDSISGSAGTWPYLTIGQSSRGDATFPLVQNGATYKKAYGGDTLLLKNMAISGTRLAGTNGVSALRPTYVDPVYAIKSVQQLIADNITIPRMAEVVAAIAG